MSENENNKNEELQFTELEDKYTVDQNNDTAEKSAFTYSQAVDAPPPPKGYSIASMILGIMSIICCCWIGMIPFTFIIPLIFGVAAIILRCVAKKKGANDGMMTAGLICGILGIILSFMGLIYSVFFLIGILGDTDAGLGGTTLIL